MTNVSDQSANQPTQELSEDRFRHRDYMEAIASIADKSSTPTPYHVALTGAWGAGKSSVLNGVQEILQSRPATPERSHTLVTRFDAWHHNEAPDIKAELYRILLNSAAKHRTLRQRWMNPVPRSVAGPTAIEDFLLRLVRATILVAMLSLVAAFLVVAVYQDMASATTFVFGLLLAFARLLLNAAGQALLLASSSVVVVALVPVLVKLWMDYRSSMGSLGRRIPRVESHRVEELRSSLHQVLRELDGANRVVLLIEDLDRCTAENVRRVLEALRQVLDAPQLITVVAVDVEAITRKLATLDDWEERDVDALLAKVFDLRFDIPLFPPQQLPHKLHNSSAAREKQVQEMTLGGLTRHAWASLFAPTWAAWSPHAGEIIVLKSGRRSLDILAFLFVLISLYPLAVVAALGESHFKTYPINYRDLETRGRFWSKHHAWSLLMIPMLLSLVVMHGIVSVVFNLTTAMFLVGVSYILVLGTPFVSLLLLGLLFQRDERLLRKYRPLIESDKQSEACKKLPPRLRGRRAAAVEQEARWRGDILKSPELRNSQEKILGNVAMTPREFKQWRNRLHLALELAKKRGTLDDVKDIETWARWTFLQERHPRATELLALSLYESHESFAAVAKDWPPGDRRIYWMPFPLAYLAPELLLIPDFNES